MPDPFRDALLTHIRGVIEITIELYTQWGRVPTAEEVLHRLNHP